VCLNDLKLHGFFRVYTLIGREGAEKISDLLKEFHIL
jgi:hypothetical protein